jgi:hypothetical protein
MSAAFVVFFKISTNFSIEFVYFSGLKSYSCEFETDVLFLWCMPTLIGLNSLNVLLKYYALSLAYTGAGFFTFSVTIL